MSTFAGQALFPPTENRVVFPWGVASLPAPYLQSLAHLHSLKLFLEQQQHHVARNILQASLYTHSPGRILLLVEVAVCWSCGWIDCSS
jgi:hypothetical protein